MFMIYIIYRLEKINNKIKNIENKLKEEENKKEKYEIDNFKIVKA